MSIVIKLLHKYTALLDYCGSPRLQYLHLTKKEIDELHESLKGVKGVEYSLQDKYENIISLDGYDFMVVLKKNKNNER